MVLSVSSINNSFRVLFTITLLTLAFNLTKCDSSSTEVNDNSDSETEMPSLPSILFLGDSLTAGLNLAESDSFPALIQEKINAAGLEYTVINAGRSGDTSAGGLNRLSWYLQDELNLEHVIIGLGNNDAMRGLDLDEMEQNIRSIIDEVKAFDSEIEIYIFQFLTFPSMGEQYARDFAAVFPRIAREKEIKILPFPLQGIASRSEFNQDDGIHPNKEGMKIVAENIWNALGPHLQD